IYNKTKKYLKIYKIYQNFMSLQKIVSKYIKNI
ncbi:MAG: hypothetical protein RLZZ102_397, partial [Pseudomonadota bacterium]